MKGLHFTSGSDGLCTSHDMTVAGSRGMNLQPFSVFPVSGPLHPAASQHRAGRTHPQAQCCWPTPAPAPTPVACVCLHHAYLHDMYDGGGDDGLVGSPHTHPKPCEFIAVEPCWSCWSALLRVRTSCCVLCVGGWNRVCAGHAPFLYAYIRQGARRRVSHSYRHQRDTSSAHECNRAGQLVISAMVYLTAAFFLHPTFFTYLDGKMTLSNSCAMPSERPMALGP